MAFKPVENITINGSIKAFNGYIFNVDYDISMSDAPSQLTLHFVSEDGTYTEPTLSTKIPYRINIGDTINENFYAISYEEKKSSGSSGGKTLEVTFIDGSLLLDNIWIGLHKKQGYNPSAKSNLNIYNLPEYIPNPFAVGIVDTSGSDPNMLIIGTEQHPCDIDEDQVFSENDLALLIYDDTDPCQIRCNTEPITLNMLAVECTNKTKIEIFEVNYTFPDLLDAIGTRIRINNYPNIVNKYYRANHIGSVRDVLRNWCSSFGLNFYWEKDGLNFIDVSKRPLIVVPSFTCVDSYSHKKTLEGTVRRGAISHYQQPGKILDKTCKDGQVVGLTCLTLRDLYGDVWKPTYGDGSTGQPDGGGDPISGDDVEYKDDVYPNGVPIEKLEEACVCAYYDEHLRWLYILRNYYALNEIKDFVDKKNQTLDRFGGLQILKVYDKYGSDPSQTDSKDVYNQLVQSDAKFNNDINETQNFLDNEGFFIVAKFDSRKLQDQFRKEENLAISFIGRHWLRSYHSPYYGEAPEIKPQGQYIGATASELKNCAFAHFQHSNNSKVGNLAKAIIAATPVATGSSPYEAKQQLKKDVKSIIYYERPDGIWSPSRDTLNYFTTVLDGLQDTMPMARTGVDKNKIREYLSNELDNGTVTEDDIDKGKIVVLLMYRGYFTMTSQVTYNPFEENGFNLPVANVINASVGLSTKRAVRFSVWGTPVDTPAGASVQFNKDYDADLLENKHSLNTPNFDLSQPANLAAPSYGVVVVSSSTPHIEIPKMEATFVSPPPDVDVLKTEYHIRSQIDDHTIRALNHLQKDCIPDVKLLQEAHQKFNVDLTYSVTAPFESYEFGIAGIDLPNTSASISTGLESLQIRIDDKGAFSNYRIGNSKFLPISEDVQIQGLEFKLNLARPVADPFTNSIKPYKAPNS